MDQKVCLDTDACIAIINRKGGYQSILNKILYSRVFVSTVTLFELFLRKTNVVEVENFIKDLEILNFDTTSARKASEILKILKNEGELIEVRDLFIASAAIVNDCSLATFNKKHFSRIKELELLNF